jgi:hypothetical protein
MRCLIIIKGNKDSEAGVLPDEKFIGEMMKYNEELVKAGVMLAAEGLQPSSKGVKIKFSPGKVTVVDGPFTEAKELIAGFWIWQVRSIEEAIEWVKRCPKPDNSNVEEGEIEIRPIFEPADFGARLTPELREKEEQLRAEVEKQNK